MTGVGNPRPAPWLFSFRCARGPMRSLPVIRLRQARTVGIQVPTKIGSVEVAQHELPVLHDEVDALQRAAHGPGDGVHTGRVAGELAGLRLAVAVADPDAGRLVPGPQDLGVQGLARRDQALERWQWAEVDALGHHAVLRRGHAEDVDVLALDDLQALGGVEARVVQEGGGAAQPGGDEDVAGGLRPAARGGAPDQGARGRARARCRPAGAGRAGSAGRGRRPSARRPCPR